MTAGDWPLWVGIPVTVLVLLGGFALAAIVGLWIQTGDHRNCPCPNCQAWRQQNTGRKP